MSLTADDPGNPYLLPSSARPHQPSREAPLTAHGQPSRRPRRPLYSEGRPPVAIPAREGGYTSVPASSRQLPTPLNLILNERGANARLLSDAALVEHRIIESLCAGGIILWGPGHVLRVSAALGLAPTDFLTGDQLTHLWSKL